MWDQSNFVFSQRNQNESSPDFNTNPNHPLLRGFYITFNLIKNTLLLTILKLGLKLHQFYNSKIKVTVVIIVAKENFLTFLIGHMLVLYETVAQNLHLVVFSFINEQGMTKQLLFSVFDCFLNQHPDEVRQYLVDMIFDLVFAKLNSFLICKQKHYFQISTKEIQN